ncbi:MAG: hypothetical protein JSV65_13755, partial [Armatimonadota bacterium]
MTVFLSTGAPTTYQERGAKMRRSFSLPQIVGIVQISSDGRTKLSKAVRRYLGLSDGRRLFLDLGDEIILTARRGKRSELLVEAGDRMSLPEAALRTLRIDGKSLVGLVEREKALAVKRLEITEREARRARASDLETSHEIVRRAETNPMPDTLLSELRRQHEASALRHHVMDFLAGRQTLEAWRARRLLDRAERSDGALRKSLLEERLARQHENGSWEGRVTATARNLRELADLGMTRNALGIRRAVEWLMRRPESDHNPGMFFLADELVAEQASIVNRRQHGDRVRFREVKAREVKLVMVADDLLMRPCGPRLMWPNALALEALLRLGYEKHERVQRALGTMLREWCECGYQHGFSDWRRKDPLDTEDIEAVERDCVREFRYGGLKSLSELEHADMSHTPFRFPRIAHKATARGDEYLLEMPTHLQGCEVITTRAMSSVKNVKIRKFA